MTATDRATAYMDAFRHSPASWPRVVREDGRDVLYATWVLGNDYRNKTKYYGSYPPSYLERVMALFPDKQQILHAFSGSLPPGGYTRLDINPALNPDVVGSVYQVAALVNGFGFDLVCADPPYSAADAEAYGTPGIDRRKAVHALSQVTVAGGHLAWLDTCWPMHSKRDWLTVGRILVQRSTNHRVRVLTLFERVH